MDKYQQRAVGEQIWNNARERRRWISERKFLRKRGIVKKLKDAIEHGGGAKEAVTCGRMPEEIEVAGGCNHLYSAA